MKNWNRLKKFISNNDCGEYQAQRILLDAIDAALESGEWKKLDTSDSQYDALTDLLCDLAFAEECDYDYAIAAIAALATLIVCKRYGAAGE